MSGQCGWGRGGPCTIASLFTLYDYSFRPTDLARTDVVAWAKEGRAACADEMYLNPAPYPSREAWCQVLCARAEARLAALDPLLPTVLVNHYPPAPRPCADAAHPAVFAVVWNICDDLIGQRGFARKTVIYGHLHIRRTDDWDGVRYEEVSLGYPKHWDQGAGVQAYLRRIFAGSLGKGAGVP